MMSPSAYADAGLKLHPNGFGEKSYAAWKAQQGQSDTRGNARHALYFQKMTATSTFAAGIARITGLEGQPATALTALEWEHRNDGHCGAGAPRWNVFLTDSDGNSYVVFFGCDEAVHTPGSEFGWTRDTHLAPATTIASRTGLAAADLTITGLQIVFDEGTDVGVGYVYLDNVKVNNQVWTSPSDNSK